MNETERTRTILQGGPIATFEELFASEYERLARSMWLLTGNRSEGEDLAQEAMARVLERWDRVRLAADPVAYLYRVAFNLNNRLIRRLSRQRTVERSSTTATASMESEVVELLHEISRLPRPDRDALVLMTWLGLSSEEAGRILGVRASTARVRLHRARVRLSRALEL